MIKTLSSEQLAFMIDSNPSCKGMLTGYIAEQVLQNKLLEDPCFISVIKIPDQDKRKGDLLVHYKSADLDEKFSIEVKCVRSNTGKELLLDGGTTGQVFVGFSDSTLMEDGSRTSCTLRGSFDILAICTITISGSWDFYFIHNKYLPSSDKYPDRLKANISINTLNTPCLHTDLRRVIQDLN